MGSEIKGYSILGKIAKGGMGEVYKAIHTGLNKEVILKKLSPNAPATFLDRFKREAGIMMDISHPNIVHMFDYFKEGNSAYIAMEYIAGYSLSEVLKKFGKLPVYLASYIIYEVAKGLQYAHQKGIIHRDIKPGNVLISMDGEIKLTDFGIAFKTDSHNKDNMTKTGTVLGTPAYMSPEQIQSSKDVDLRSDIYSLGILFYEMITGKRPYANEFSMENLRRINKGKFHGIKKQNRNVPYKIIRIIKKMMHHNKNRRYQSATDVINILSKFIESKFKDTNKIREIFSKVIIDENEKYLDVFKYPGFYTVIDIFGKMCLFFLIGIGVFYSVRNITPQVYVNLINKNKNGLTDITINALYKVDSCKIKLSKTGDNKKYEFSFYDFKGLTAKNNTIIESGKYDVMISYNKYTINKQIYIYPYVVKKKNLIKLNIVEPVISSFKVYTTFTDRETGLKLNEYNLYYKVSGTKKYLEYSDDINLLNGNTYDFGLLKKDYIFAEINNLTVNKWSDTVILNFSSAKRKVLVEIDKPPMNFDIAIDDDIPVFADEDGLEPLNLKNTNSESSFFLQPGSYTISFKNIKNNIVLKKQITLVKNKNIHLYFTRDSEGDIYVVTKVK